VVLSLPLSLGVLSGSMCLAGSISEKINPPNGGLISYLAGAAVAFPMFVVLGGLLVWGDVALVRAAS